MIGNVIKKDTQCISFDNKQCPKGLHPSPPSQIPHHSCQRTPQSKAPQIPQFLHDALSLASASFKPAHSSPINFYQFEINKS